MTLLDDAELRTRLGRAARRSYENSPFQPAAVGREFITIYQDMCATHRAAPPHDRRGASLRDGRGRRRLRDPAAHRLLRAGHLGAARHDRRVAT